ncbi:4-hydroxy-tetrahydrodipicolinate synthase [Peptostreptococcus faecalis]|uniref:4-hydroxy-tetrahydrodipicolinate synthase n=1 Tax=Peptostreptococcus faecalis TaxID=2045015 RepID=UPI000C7B811F|nr:4-hydroxy-tetrahydrodipicolinate synthase [Peptostreptococcus faecalis]
MTTLFNGVATALATPMNYDSSVDYESYEKLVRFQLESGINALIVSGTTGEGSTLTTEEKIELLKRTQDIRGDKYNCPIILGTGSNNTRASIEETILAEKYGADAALIVTPYYNKTSQKGLVAHYFAIADAVNIPIILYNVPGRTGMTIEPETVVELSKHPNIVALKDATGSLKYMAKLKGLLGENRDFKLYSGEDGTFFDFLVYGGDGVISVVANATPKLFLEVYNLYRNNEVNASRDLQLKMDPFIATLFSDVSPTPLKAVLKHMGIMEENFRLPLIPTTDTVRNNVIREYDVCKELEVTL